MSVSERSVFFCLNWYCSQSKHLFFQLPQQPCLELTGKPFIRWWLVRDRKSAGRCLGSSLFLFVLFFLLLVFSGVCTWSTSPSLVQTWRHHPFTLVDCSLSFMECNDRWDTYCFLFSFDCIGWDAKWERATKVVSKITNRIRSFFTGDIGCWRIVMDDLVRRDCTDVSPCSNNSLFCLDTYLHYKDPHAVFLVWFLFHRILEGYSSPLILLFLVDMIFLLITIILGSISFDFPASIPKILPPLFFVLFLLVKVTREIYYVSHYFFRQSQLENHKLQDDQEVYIPLSSSSIGENCSYYSSCVYVVCALFLCTEYHSLYCGQTYF